MGRLYQEILYMHYTYGHNVDTMSLYSPLNLYHIILWILDFKHILLLLLFYYIEVWGSASKCHLNSLFLLQKKIIRIIMTYSCYLTHTDPIFKDLRILPLDKLVFDSIRITITITKYLFRQNRTRNIRKGNINDTHGKSNITTFVTRRLH